MAHRIEVPVSKEGDFQRVDAQFRHWISSAPGAQFPPEANRYHLYISYACPWASRCLAVLNLKGLQDAVSVSVTNSKLAATKPNIDTHSGWTFPTAGDHNTEPGATADPHNHATTVRQLYEIAAPIGSYTGRYSVPVLWDTKTSQIVSNESSEIIRMFNAEFNHIATHPQVNLYPANLRAAIDDVNSWVFTDINNGVYRCGFAVKQAPYEAAFRALFTALDKCEAILGKQRFIAGDALTEADVRLFMTLIRFDAVYVVLFKCNKKFIREYPNLFNYTKDLFQVPGIGATVHMRHIKEHYFGSLLMINPQGIVAVGQEIDYSAPHDRHRFSSKHSA